MDRTAQGQRELPDGCGTASRPEATAPLLHSPCGAPFGPSAPSAAARPFCCPALSALGCLTSLARLGPPMPSAAFCRPVRAAPATLSPLRDSRQISQGKTQNVWRVGAGLLQHTPVRMADFAVTCPLVPGGPHLGSGSCASPRAVGLGFLQTPPHGDAHALLLAFGSARTWREDFHLARSVPCLAHTSWRSGAARFPPSPGAAS